MLVRLCQGTRAVLTLNSSNEIYLFHMFMISEMAGSEYMMNAVDVVVNRQLSNSSRRISAAKATLL